MSYPLQAGLPVSPELLLIVLVAAVQLAPALIVVWYIYRDAQGRNSDHALAWTVGALFGGPIVWVLYFVVRDEVGRGSPSASGVA